MSEVQGISKVQGMSTDRRNALLLAIDTCGATGSVALARVQDGRLHLLGEATLPSGEFAAGILVAARTLLQDADSTADQLDGVVVVSGPGSYTGIRVGLATGKGLVDARQIPLLAVSRLQVMEYRAAVGCVALDAWRGQMFVGMRTAGMGWTERLVTAGEFTTGAQGLPIPQRVAVCEETVAQLLEMLAEELEVLRMAPPGAAQALDAVLDRWLRGDAEDAAVLDGHYLRGTEATPPLSSVPS